VLFDSSERAAQLEAEVVSSAARKAKVTTVTFEVHGLSDVQAAFASMAKSRPQALYVVDSPITTGMRGQIAAGALEIRVPMISEGSSFAEAGGVLTYGAKESHALKRGAVYVDKILKGAKPGDLPIEQPTEFELIVNLKAAKAVALRVPSSILQRADRVIR
jgi:putative ABC transport system substrate-binding protein